MFWYNCIDSKLTYLITGKFLVPKWKAKVIWKHIENDENNICLMRKKLIENRKIFQFVYPKTYPGV